MKKLIFGLLISLPILSFGQVVVFDTLNFGLQAGNGVWSGAIAVDSITNRIYTANLLSSNVSIINGINNSVITTIEVGKYPYAIAINPVTNRIYVANISDTVFVIDGASNSVTAKVSLGNSSYGHCIGVNSATNRIYVTNSDDSMIYVINGSNNLVIDTIIVDNNPHGGIAVNPVTNRIYVGGSFALAIDGATNSIIDTISSDNVYGICVNPKTNRVYTTNYYDTSISVIDEVNDSVIARIKIGRYPENIDINPNTNRIYVSNQYDSLFVIDGTNNNVIDIIEITDNGGGPFAVNPHTNYIYTYTFARPNKISVISGISNLIVDTISIGNIIVSVATNSTTNYTYLTVWDSVAIINGIDNSVFTKVKTEDYAEDIAVNPNTNKIYASIYDSNAVLVIDGISNLATDTIKFSNHPRGIIVNPLTNRIYITLGNIISVIDGVNNSIIDTIEISSDECIAINSSTNYLYATSRRDHQLTVLLVIYEPTGLVVDSVEISGGATGILVNSNTNHIYVTTREGDVFIIDGISNSIIKTIKIGTEDQSGGTMYMKFGINSKINNIYVPSMEDNNISVIDGISDSAIQVVNVGKRPVSVSVNDSTGRIYVSCPFDGTVWVLLDMTGVEENQKPTLQNPKLEIYSNPSIKSTVISYQLPIKDKITLKVYDISGRIIKTLVDEEKEAGSHSVSLDTKDLATGVYFVKLKAGENKVTKKIVMMK